MPTSPWENTLVRNSCPYAAGDTDDAHDQPIPANIRATLDTGKAYALVHDKMVPVQVEEVVNFPNANSANSFGLPWRRKELVLDTAEPPTESIRSVAHSRRATRRTRSVALARNASRTRSIYLIALASDRDVTIIDEEHEEQALTS